jgi:FkbM family methyltransferase
MVMFKEPINGLLGLWHKKIINTPDPEIPCIHQITLGDLRFPFWIGNMHAKKWWQKDRLEMGAEFTFLKSSLAAYRARCIGKFHVFDVGAHHGIQTVPMAIWGGKDCSVHAIEANAENALLLCANVGLNRLTNCIVTNAAAGVAHGSIFVTGETVSDAGKGRRTSSISLDSYCDDYGIDCGRIGYLKIDVEGFETEVLKGAQRVLSGLPFINLEVHENDLARYNSSVEALFEHISLKRYDARLVRREVSWHETKALSSVSELPRGEVFNLLLEPRS